MPASPEILDRNTEIRAVKILHEPYAQHIGGTGCDNGISAEIAVYLKGVDHGGKNYGPAVKLMIILIYEVHQNCRSVCDDQLQEKAPKHKHET